MLTSDQGFVRLTKKEHRHVFAWFVAIYLGPKELTKLGAVTKETHGTIFSELMLRYYQRHKLNPVLMEHVKR